MKIYDTVRTEDKAKEIINDYLKKHNLKDGFFRTKETRCECGQTICLQWYNFDTYLDVAICEMCGDDNTFIDEVLNIN